MIEGLSLSSAGAFGNDEEEEDSDASPSEDEDADPSSSVLGITYVVGGGAIKKLDGGMGQYVKMVERKLERRAKKAGG